MSGLVKNEVRGVLCRMVHRNKEIPVFVHPTELKFYISNKNTHRQLLTIYNPYEFPIKYNLLTNASLKYTIDHPPCTIIAAHSYVEIGVQHHELTQKIMSRDKIMISLHDTTNKRVLGKRCIYAVILPKSYESDDEEENTQFYTPTQPNSSPRRQHRRDLEEYKVMCPLHVLLACVFLMGMLFMPTYYDTDETKESALPKFLHVSLACKIVAAYILGLITMLLLRDN